MHRKLLPILLIIGIIACSDPTPVYSQATNAVSDTVVVEDTLAIPEQKDSKLHLIIEIVGNSLGLFSAALEVPVYQSEGAYYYEYLVSAGIGTVDPLNGYVNVMGRYTTGRKHRVEVGVGIDILYSKRDTVWTDPGIPLSDAPVIPTAVLAYRYIYDSGMILRVIVPITYDVGGGRKWYIYPTLSFGFAF